MSFDRSSADVGAGKPPAGVHVGSDGWSERSVSATLSSSAAPPALGQNLLPEDRPMTPPFLLVPSHIYSQTLEFLPYEDVRSAMLAARAFGDEQTARGVRVIHVTKPAHLVARHLHQGADLDAPRRFPNLKMANLAGMLRPSPEENVLLPETAQMLFFPAFQSLAPKLHLGRIVLAADYEKDYVEMLLHHLKQYGTATTKTRPSRFGGCPIASVITFNLSTSSDFSIEFDMMRLGGLKHCGGPSAAMFPNVKGAVLIFDPNDPNMRIEVQHLYKDVIRRSCGNIPVVVIAPYATDAKRNELFVPNHHRIRKVLQRNFLRHAAHCAVFAVSMERKESASQPIFHLLHTLLGLGDAYGQEGF